MSRAARRLTLAAALVTSLLASRAAVAATLEGPITSPGSAFLVSTTFDPAEVGYVQEEYFLSGTASAYTSAGGAFTSDGAWTAARGETADYKTRIVVYRPTNPRKFNGTVVVEWLNVSGGLDAPPDWTQAHTGLIREGFAWVGVSAQKVGVDGGPALVGVVSLPLKTVDPARYGSLVHPGDSFSYDIFSQAGQAVRRPAGTGPLGPLQVKHVIAAGESQSAFRLVTYVNAVDPLEKVYDGFLIHSRSAGGAAAVRSAAGSSRRTVARADPRRRTRPGAHLPDRDRSALPAATSPPGRTTAIASACGRSPAPRTTIRTVWGSRRRTAATRRPRPTWWSRRRRSRASSRAARRSTPGSSTSW